MSGMAEYRELFVAEAQENLQALSDGALKLERADEAREAVDSLFRAAHTLKGMSATMGYEGLTRVCHAMEDVLEAVRSGGREAGPELADALLASVDAMTLMLGDVASGGDGGPAEAAVLERFRGLEKGGGPAQGPKVAQAPPPSKAAFPAEIEALLPRDEDSRLAVTRALADVPVVVRLTVSLVKDCAFKGVRALLVRKALERLGSVVATRPAGKGLEEGAFGPDFELWTSGDAAARDQEEAVLRVLEVAQVSSAELRAPLFSPPARPEASAPGAALPEPVAEALVQAPAAETQEPENGEDPLPAAAATAALHQTVRVSVERLDKVLDLVGELVTAKIRLTQIARDNALKDLNEALIQVDHVVNELQQEVTAARMVPMDQVFSRFPRLIRDLSRASGKPMELALEGGEIELDRGILSEIGDALVHLLRNAADHGIEPTAKRSAAGKPAVGTIRLEARRDKNHVVISVEDDGAGIDTERIRQVAVRKGILDAEAARRLSEEEAVALIFSPGFSTASRVTELSGRGVGVDVVRSRAEALGGSLRVENFPGRGARFRIRVPLTLAIIRALRVRVGSETYMAPVANVLEAVEYSAGELLVSGSERSVSLRGEILPLYSLGELLGLGPAALGGGAHGLVTVLVVDSGERRVGLLVDEVQGQQEIAIKNLVRALKSVRGFGGVTILGDGSVCLILDLPSLLDL